MTAPFQIRMTSTNAPHRSRLREWALRLALVLSATLLVFAGLEVVARVLRAGQHGGKEEQEQAAYTERDPLLGWRKKAGIEAEYNRREYHTKVKTNSLGLRDPERVLDPPAETFRVLALGDSFLEGYTVDAPLTVTAQLESRLRAESCAAEVINAGTAAYSTDQEALYFVSAGARLRASLVLLFVYYNDILYTDRQDYFGDAKPVFEMGGGVLKLHRYPVPFRDKPVPSATKTAEDSGGSAALELLRERLWYGAPGAHDALARLGLWNPIPKTPPRLEMRVYDRRDLAPIEDAWEKVEAVLGFLKDRVEAQGATLAIVYVPSKMEVQDASWRTTQALYKVDDSAWDLTKPQRRLSTLATKASLGFLDLTPALRAAETRFASTYFAMDGHWNARGHDAAAEAIASWMRESGQKSRSCGGRLPGSAPRGEVWTPREAGDAIPVPGPYGEARPAVSTEARLPPH